MRPKRAASWCRARAGGPGAVAVNRFSPLEQTRLKNLPPALILSAEDDPLCDEAEQYGAKLINAGVRTTVRRMPPAPLQDPDGRNECACKVHALAEIATFLAGLDR